MNKKIFSMSFITFARKLVMLMVLFFVVVGAFASNGSNLGQGVSVLIPATAEATYGTPPVLPPPVVRTCNVLASAYEVQAGTSVIITWYTQGFTKFTINGEAVSGPNGSKTFTNVQVNTTYTLVASSDDGNYNCTTSVTVLCIPVPPPTCTLNPATKIIESGESVTLTWTTTNAASASLTDFGSVPVNGSQNTGALTSNKNYTLTVVGNNGGTVTCNSAITVKPPVTTYCELTLTKSVEPKTAKPGDELTYTVKIKNTGTADCTGGGVKIVDIHDENLTYVSETHTSNLSAGYEGTPIYVSGTRTLTWNGHVLNPGEEGTIVWKGLVKQNLTCDAVTLIKNTAKATAKELNNYNLWAYSNTVETSVTSSCPIPPPTCILNPATKTIESGESVTLTWTTTNAASASLTSFGSVPVNGSQNTGALITSKSYILTVVGTNGSTITCSSVITVKNTPPAPVCEAFTANPTSIVRGSSSVLAWSTKDATRVVIDNGIGEVSASGTVSVTPLQTTEYTLKAYGQDNKEAVCKAKVIVTEPPLTPVPKCVSFIATPVTLPAGGGASVLAWSTKDATSVSISPSIGSVSLNGTTSVSISTTTTYTLTAARSGATSDSCAVTIKVEPVVPVPISCASNVTLSVNPGSIRRGNSSTISWSTTGITSLSFDQGISATGLSGSVSVEPRSTTAYTMTATDGKTTISCPVSVTVTGGGGGGSVSPSCELSISKSKINRGEEVTLKWKTNRATDIEITDSNDYVIISTENLSSSKKDDLFDGSIKVAPNKDTTYKLIAERGSRKDVCTVKVDVNDTIVFTQIRDQQPLIAGISLSQVPYTGFEAGPILTIMFYLLLMAWALYIAYLLVIRRDIVGGYQLPEAHFVAEPEDVRPDVFVAKVKTPEVPPSVNLPENLPVGNPIVGYASLAGEKIAVSTNPHHVGDSVVTALENHAHVRKVLLSSDAIRHFVGTTTSEDERIDALDEVIALAKAKFPSEDGWVVINEKRMRDLCVTCSANQKSNEAPYVPAVIPEGSGSLAEAIVTGNVIAAYEMIGHRPMFALADASADLDAVYRLRKGGKVTVSDLLAKESAKLSDEQIMEMIKALTGALDGVYTDEASAVKMAIMKAVKVVA